MTYKLQINLSIELTNDQILRKLFVKVSSKSGKTFSIFLSSEYERSQWVEALKILQVMAHISLRSYLITPRFQEKLPPNTSQAHTMSMVELQSWVTSCRSGVSNLCCSEI